MIQEHYQKAMKFAGEKHSDQKVPGTNANYLLHIANVGMEILIAFQKSDNFDIDFAIQVAILHDVLEDTDTTFEELKGAFGERVSNAVLALTKDDSFNSKKERMFDSLHRINSLEKEVGMVKLADRITNLQEPPEHWSAEKRSAYWVEARFIAYGLKNKNEYLNRRLLEQIGEYEKWII